MIPGVNIFSRKVSIASINKAGRSGGTLSPSARVLWGEALKKNLGSKEYLDWLKIDLNPAKIITVQDSKCSKN